MEEKKSSKKHLLIGGIIFAAVIIAMAVIYMVFMPKGVKGAKKITFEVTYADKTSKTFEIQTDEEFLRGALEQEKLISGTESETGLYVQEIDGVTADEGKQQWWCFTKDGEMLQTGVDSTPVQDKDHFEAALSVW